MLALKAQAHEIINDLPQDRLPTAITVLQGLQLLDKKELQEKSNSQDTMGIFSKYANIDLIPLEKDAWADAAVTKHGTN